MLFLFFFPLQLSPSASECLYIWSRQQLNAAFGRCILTSEFPPMLISFIITIRTSQLCRPGRYGGPLEVITQSSFLQKTWCRSVQHPCGGCTGSSLHVLWMQEGSVAPSYWLRRILYSSRRAFRIVYKKAQWQRPWDLAFCMKLTQGRPCSPTNLCGLSLTYADEVFPLACESVKTTECSGYISPFACLLLLFLHSVLTRMSCYSASGSLWKWKRSGSRIQPVPAYISVLP